MPIVIGDLKLENFGKNSGNLLFQQKGEKRGGGGLGGLILVGFWRFYFLVSYTPTWWDLTMTSLST